MHVFCVCTQRSCSFLSRHSSTTFVFPFILFINNNEQFLFRFYFIYFFSLLLIGSTCFAVGVCAVGVWDERQRSERTLNIFNKYSYVFFIFAIFFSLSFSSHRHTNLPVPTTASLTPALKRDPNLTLTYFCSFDAYLNNVRILCTHTLVCAFYNNNFRLYEHRTMNSI